MTPDDKALEALESGCGHGAGPDACVAAAARIRALAALAEARREDIGRLHACVDTLMDEAERLTNERDAAMRARCANFDAVSAERDAFRAEVEREAARGGQS